MSVSQRLALMGGVSILALAYAAPAPAQSIGCMRMPSTVGQFFGYGYGAGHHAPIVRTPGQHAQGTPRRVVAPACHGALTPAGYAPIGCIGGNCGGPMMAVPAGPMLAQPYQGAPQYAYPTYGALAP